MVATGNKAVFLPPIEDVYPSACYLSLYYASETFLLELSVIRLYSIPTTPQVDETEKNSIDGSNYRGF